MYSRVVEELFSMGCKGRSEGSRRRGCDLGGRSLWRANASVEACATDAGRAEVMILVSSF